MKTEKKTKAQRIAWAIFKGESFTSSVKVSNIWYVVPQEPVRDPAWLSAHGM